MDWKKLINDLMSEHVTQTQIAAECGVSQSAVSDLHRGSTRQPNFEFGQKLLAMHTLRRKTLPAAAEEGQG